MTTRDPKTPENTDKKLGWLPSDDTKQGLLKEVDLKISVLKDSLNATSS